MNSEILQTYIEALPGYKLIANKEVAIPYYSYNAHFLYSQKGMLPIVQDYVLEFIQLELNENTISSILGIPLDLIQDARYSLMQEDLIDPETEVLTELGEEYLACKKLDRLERGESNILINTLTSDIDINVNNSMVHRDAQQYYCYKAPISTVTTETIDFRQMQKVLRIYCEKNEFDTDSKLIDIIYIKKKETRYRRLDILVFINVKEEIRLLAVENGQRRNRYEEILLELDNNGQDLLKTRIFKYFDGEYVQKIYEICNPLDIKQSVDYMDYISMSKDMTLIFPLIDSSIINNYIINEIEGKLHSKHTVNIILCGEKYSNTYQENMIQKLRKLAKKNKKLVIRHCIEYFPFIHINAEGTNCIQFLSLCNLNLKSTTNGVLSYYNNVSIEKADEILNLINSVIAENQSAIYPIELKSLDKIYELWLDFDNTFLSKYGFSMFPEGGMRNREAFISIALSSNEKSFNDFLNIINTSIFESIKQEGKRNTGDKNFFWSTFANEYPALYKTIDKIRVYRNKAHHSELDQKNSRLYYEYLKEDLKGQFVEFVDGGYEFLQCKLTAEMYDNLRNILMVNAT